MDSTSASPLVLQLCDLLHNPVFPAQLASAIKANPSESLVLRIDASLVTSAQASLHKGSLHLVWLFLLAISWSDFLGLYRPL